MTVGYEPTMSAATTAETDTLTASAATPGASTPVTSPSPPAGTGEAGSCPQLVLPLFPEWDGVTLPIPYDTIPY